MGGRGATSNLAKLAKYGTEYKQVKTNIVGKKLHTKDKRILFIETTNEQKQSKTPYESMMPHRVYVLINAKNRNIKSITFTDKKGFAYKFIDVNQVHYEIGKGKLGHTHMGYNRKEPREMNRSERKLVQKVYIAYNMPKYTKKKKGGVTEWLKSIKYFRPGKT